MKSKNSNLIVIITLGFCAGTALAQKAGETIGYIGGSFIITNSSISAPSSSGVQASTFNAITQGASGNSPNTGMLSFALMQMITDNIAAELSAGYPPTLNLNVTLPNNIGIGTNGTYNNAASTSAWSPTIYAKYIFNGPSDQLRPFIGAGLNYTWFTNAKVGSAAVPQTLGGGGLSLSSSWNPAITVGAIYNFNNNWSLRGNVDYIPISTNATFTSGSSYTIPNGPTLTTSGNTTSIKITVNPVLAGLSLGYKF